MKATQTLFAQLQSVTAYCGLSTVHEHIALPRQFLFLGRTVSESSKTDLHASFCGPPSCSDSGRLAIASPSTEQHVTQADQQHLHRRLATPPAAPRRKLPQCTFQINIPTACGSTAATPLPGGTSDPSPTLYQHVHNYYLQSEAGKAQSITTLGEQATQAASMSALLAHAEPISSVEHLLQRLQTRSTPPATVSSEQESSGNHGTSALSSCNLLDTGAAPRLVETSLQGCMPSSPVRSETGSFQDEKAAGVQPRPCAHATHPVDSWLAHSHGQTQQGWEGTHAGAENRGHASGSG
ncbi:hypothetical protein ABBQ38_004759 [Trebouxia sp. C0009 RCD-2024]